MHRLNIEILFSLLILAAPLCAETHNDPESTGRPLTDKAALLCTDKSKAAQAKIVDQIKELVGWNKKQPIAANEQPNVNYVYPTRNTKGQILSGNSRIPKPMTTEQMFLAWEENQRLVFSGREHTEARDYIPDIFRALGWHPTSEKILDRFQRTLDKSTAARKKAPLDRTKSDLWHIAAVGEHEAVELQAWLNHYRQIQGDDEEDTKKKRRHFLNKHPKKYDFTAEGKTSLVGLKWRYNYSSNVLHYPIQKLQENSDDKEAVKEIKNAVSRFVALSQRERSSWTPEQVYFMDRAPSPEMRKAAVLLRDLGHLTHRETKKLLNYDVPDLEFEGKPKKMLDDFYLSHMLHDARKWKYALEKGWSVSRPDRGTTSYRFPAAILTRFYKLKLGLLGGSLRKMETYLDKKKDEVFTRDLGHHEKTSTMFLNWRHKNEGTKQGELDKAAIKEKRTKLNELMLRLFVCPFPYDNNDPFHRYLALQSRYISQLDDLKNFEREIMRGLVAIRKGEDAEGNVARPEHFDYQRNLRANSRGLLKGIWGDKLKSQPWEEQAKALKAEYKRWAGDMEKAKRIAESIVPADRKDPDFYKKYKANLAKRKEIEQLQADALPNLKRIHSELRLLTDQQVSNLRTWRIESRQLDTRQRIFEELGGDILKELDREKRAILLPRRILEGREKGLVESLERYDQERELYNSYTFEMLNHAGGIEYGAANFEGERSRAASDKAAMDYVKRWTDLGTFDEVHEFNQIASQAHSRSLRRIDEYLLRRNLMPLFVNDYEKWNDFNKNARFVWWEDAMKAPDADPEASAIEYSNYNIGIKNRKAGFVDAEIARRKKRDEDEAQRMKDKKVKFKPGDGGPQVLKEEEYEAQILSELKDQFPRVRFHSQISHALTEIGMKSFNFGQFPGSSGSSQATLPKFGGN